MSKFWDAVGEALEEKSLFPAEVLEHGSLLDELVVRVMEIIPWPCTFGVCNPGIIHPVNDGESFVLMDVGFGVVGPTVESDLHITTFCPTERVKEVLVLLSDNQEED